MASDKVQRALIPTKIYIDSPKPRTIDLAQFAIEERRPGQVQITRRCSRRYVYTTSSLFYRFADNLFLGHLGKFTLSLHWLNLGNQPVEILIEDVYLLVVPSPQANADPDEEERRAQATKSERLENAELLHMNGQAEDLLQ